MNIGQHHLNVRKRVSKKLEPYPSPDALKRLLDKSMLFIALAGPLATLPQIYQIFLTQDVKGLSALTWSVWTLLSGVWLVYGIVHRELPIVASNAIYIALQGTVVIAIFVFG